MKKKSVVICFSGGLDSTVAALMAAESPDIKTVHLVTGIRPGIFVMPSWAKATFHMLNRFIPGKFRYHAINNLKLSTDLLMHHGKASIFNTSNYCIACQLANLSSAILIAKTNNCSEIWFGTPADDNVSLETSPSVQKHYKKIAQAIGLELKMPLLKAGFNREKELNWLQKRNLKLGLKLPGSDNLRFRYKDSMLGCQQICIYGTCMFPLTFFLKKEQFASSINELIKTKSQATIDYITKENS